LLAAATLATGARAPRARQDPPHSAALLSPEVRAKLAESASTELAQCEGRLAAALLERDPWRAPVIADARLGVFDLTARGAWRATLQAQEVALAAIDTSMLEAQRRIDHARAVAFCRAETARVQLTSELSRDPAFHVERLELALRAFVRIDNAERVAAQTPLLLAQLQAVPDALEAFRTLLTDPDRVGVRAGIDACARLREVIDGEIAALCTRIAAPASEPAQGPASEPVPVPAPPAAAGPVPAVSPDAAPAPTALAAGTQAELDLARATAGAALAEFAGWLERELLPRAAPPPAIDADGWFAIARERTGSTLDRADLALALLAAIGELEPRCAAPDAQAPRAEPLTPQAALGAALTSRGSRNVLDDLGIVPKDATQMRIAVRTAPTRTVPYANVQETLDGSCWVEIGLPGPQWPAAARARRELELGPANRAAFSVVRGSAGAGLRIGRRAALCAPAQRALVDACVDVGFGLYAADALRYLPHPQNPMRALPGAGVALARMQRLECARLLASVYMWVERRADDAVREDLVRYAGIDAAQAAVEFDASRRDPWHGIAALAWLEFRALARALAAGDAADADARAPILRTFALVARHPADRPADLVAMLERARAQPREAAEPGAPTAADAPADPTAPATADRPKRDS
jgi:hypothetical protein